MSTIHFPPLDHASPEGLLAIGGNLEIETLLSAYSQGIFPWPHEEEPLLWFAPPKRAILDFKNFHIPKRLQQALKQNKFYYQIDSAFTQVIEACAKGKTRKSQGTWILPSMIQAYVKLHQAGYAHSFECFNQDQQLVGGLYGVSLGNYFAAESMFYHESPASKATLVFAVETLKKRGATWLDAQVMSPLLKSFGAQEISREDFTRRLKVSLNQKKLF
ncbi:MAG: leucyl/phenylalanyl-tRNA--protein transferase [Deltaproteobacteria bacterium]|nr:leucyl/phenylalanyl-tRNA--protein transferase [Deltaproteobacteria bacterium]